MQKRNEPKRRPKYGPNATSFSTFKYITVAHCMKLLYRTISFPFSIAILVHSPRVNDAYGMGFFKRYLLGLRFAINSFFLESATSFKANLVMAMKLLELSPESPGVIVECGCFKGASSANLSLIAQITGRKLVVCDSFQGLPEPQDYDIKNFPQYSEFEGRYSGSLPEVRDNVKRYGAIDSVEFVEGWFSDTLPDFNQAIALAYIDVDYHSSLHDCIVNLWGHLQDRAFLFIDEYIYPDYCALFFSEPFWEYHFACSPPGLIGAGTGVGVGEFYLGSHKEVILYQDPASVAYTRKGNKSVWTYQPKET